MIQINSKRISLYSLNYKELTHYDEEPALFCGRLDLRNAPFAVDEEFLTEFYSSVREFTLPAMEANPAYEYNFFHLIVHPADKRFIGCVGSTGVPDANGEIMLGYFIDKKYEGQGFTTEAVAAFCAWLSHPELRALIADTFPGLLASQRILEKNNFLKVSDDGEIQRWRREK